jgi:hypothetical protein
MTFEHLLKAAVAVTVAGLIALCGMFTSSPRVHADDDRDLVSIGLAIAPVKLNLNGKDRYLVGLGSFIVNAQADCNGCHTAEPNGV